MTGLRLVFLSACRTAYTADTDLLDEAIHLTSAFLLAGARQVIGTLWEVHDATAPEMAASFYRASARLQAHSTPIRPHAPCTMPSGRSATGTCGSRSCGRGTCTWGPDARRCLSCDEDSGRGAPCRSSPSLRAPDRVHARSLDRGAQDRGAEAPPLRADPRRRSRLRAESAPPVATTSLPPHPATTGSVRHPAPSCSPSEPTRAPGSCSDAVQGRQNATPWLAPAPRRACPVLVPAPAVSGCPYLGSRQHPH